MASCSSVAKEERDENTIMLPNWLELPRDLTANILHRLGAFEIITNARKVCPLWWNICKDPLMWRTINISRYNIPDKYLGSSYFVPSLVKIYCYVIDLSCGHLEEIVMEHFANDYLLQYITERASHLRRIEFSNFGLGQISDKVFKEAVKKLSLLVELGISSNNIGSDSLEVVGQCCPLLKSLKYDRTLTGELDESNKVAFTIAKTMRRLCYLKISGILLTNVGLLAILDGCSLLESLDVLRSTNVELSESLLKRCQRQIKDLKLPNQIVDLDYVIRFPSLSDYEKLSFFLWPIVYDSIQNIRRLKC